MGFARSIISRVNNFQVRTLAGLTTKKLLPHIKEGESVLDIGCGLGYQAQDIQRKKGVRVTGIDVVDYTDSDFDCQLFDGRRIPFDDKSFDVSYFAYVLHHAAEPMKLLADSIRVTKKRILILEDTPSNFFDRALDAYHGWSFNKFYKLKHKAVFRTRNQWKQIFDQFHVKEVHTFPLGRFDREPYFPISRTLFVLDV